ncbi:MAG: glycosyltransferase family 2 protein [Patescibacteria group bacterium]|nr:glycosyltransferase family 2 protein [Patescibacteria group bacterium]
MRDEIFVIIPAYNEAARIGAVLEGAEKYCRNIIVVDDGSDDETSEVAKRHKIIVLRHKVNLGKGAALKTGSKAALKLGAKILVFMDADGQHQAEDIPHFIQGIKEGYDLVIGMRRFNRRMPFSMLVGNKIFSRLIYYLYNFNLPDTQCGFRALRASVYFKIQWMAQGYEVETEMLLSALRKKLRCAAIPIQAIYYDIYKGTTIVDGIKILMKILEQRISLKNF